MTALLWMLWYHSDYSFVISKNECTPGLCYVDFTIIVLGQCLAHILGPHYVWFRLSQTEDVQWWEKKKVHHSSKMVVVGFTVRQTQTWKLQKVTFSHSLWLRVCGAWDWSIGKYRRCFQLSQDEKKNAFFHPLPPSTSTTLRFLSASCHCVWTPALHWESVD